MDELPREKLTKSTKILELITTILIVSRKVVAHRPSAAARPRGAVPGETNLPTQVITDTTVA